MGRNRRRAFPKEPFEAIIEDLSHDGRGVTSFGEKTAEKTLRLLRPDFQAKGTDYTLKTVPEREVLKELGIKAVICGDPKDHSTTSLIKKIKKYFH